MFEKIDKENNIDKTTPFLWAIITGDQENIDKFIRRGIYRENQRDFMERDALHLAAGNGNVDAVRSLLAAGFDPNSRDVFHRTPLYYAIIRSPSPVIAKMLFDHGAIIPERKVNTEVGLFFDLIIMCRPTIEERELIQMLLDHGAIIDDPVAPGGRQPLHYASMSNNIVLIEVLLESGADINATNHFGMTPIDVAKFFGCREAQFVLENAAISNIL